MKDYWTTKEGIEIAHCDLSDSHLLNILKFVQKKAKEMDGEVIDGGGIDADDIWYDIGHEEDWLRAYGYYRLKEEAIKRNLTPSQ